MKAQGNPSQQPAIGVQLDGGSQARIVNQRRFWIWPLVAACVLAVIGYAIRSAVETAMKASLANELHTLLDADVATLRIWMKLQESTAQTVANDRDVRKVVEEIVALGKAPEGTDAALLVSPQVAKLREEIEPLLEAHEYEEFVLVSRDGRILASSRDELIGKDALSGYADFFQGVFEGRATVSHPIPSLVMLLDSDGQWRAGIPTMFVAAAVVDPKGESMAALCLRLKPEETFSRVLQVARIGESGETYAFDKTGVMLSESRFTADLVRLGMIPETAVARSTLALRLRDPQVDLTAGERPPRPPEERPLTRMAQSAIQGIPGVDVDGYRDYRGVRVVGAWTWLDEYQFGVVNEVDLSEAYRPLLILRRAFWGLFGLLALSSAGLGVFSVVVARLQKAARRSALQARQLGQYVLERKIGSGGMGVVYKGHHAMLRRPTAIKLLHVEKVTDESVRRFEREVRLTCQLTHPNTIAIYDYGRTPEGLFYYAMEYLEGCSLQELVDRHGPQPEGRVVQLLQQICGSLAEAHDAGLVHRDIKPANVMLTNRGGMFDFVKVLDFGLVRSTEEKDLMLPAAGGLTGTPLYMSPEAIDRPKEVDARSDLYALGAVGYFLLTGEPVFVGKSVLDVCMQHFNGTPQRPSDRLGKPVSKPLEDLLLMCLAKRPADRPASARLLALELAAIALEAPWTQRDAERWWQERSAPTVTLEEVPTNSSVTAHNQMLVTLVQEERTRPAASTEVTHPPQ